MGSPPPVTYPLAMRFTVRPPVLFLVVAQTATACLGGGDEGGDPAPAPEDQVEIGPIEELPADGPVLDLEQPALVPLDDDEAIDALVDELQEELVENLETQGIDLEQPALVPLDDEESGLGFPLTGDICNDWAIKWMDVLLAFPDFSNAINNPEDPEIWVGLQTMYLVMADTWAWVATAVPGDRDDLSTNALALSDHITAIVPLLTPDTIDQVDTSWHDPLALPIVDYLVAECIAQFADVSPADMIGSFLDLP